LLGAVLMALLFHLVPAPTPARADITDCFQALAPLEQAVKAAEVAAKAGGCSSAAAGDPLMAMTIAAMTAAAVAGEFSTIAQCNSLVDSSVGRLIAKALLQLPLDTYTKTMLQQFINGSLPVSFTELVASLPGLNAMIYYMQCGCNVAGAPGEFQKLADDYADAAESCANLASDVVNAGLDAMGDFGESIHEALHGPSLTPGVQQETSCYVWTLPDEIWTKKHITTDPAFDCDVIRCEKGHYVVHKTDLSGTKLSKCVAACPDPIKTFKGGSQCYSTVDSKPVNGVCTQLPGVVHCCAPGQAVFKWGVCSPACSDGIQYYDTKLNRCTACKTGWYPVYKSSESSVGACAECRPGQTYDWSSRKCVPLNCGIGYVDPNNPHFCTVCPAGQIYSAAMKRCECTQGTIRKGRNCVCPAGAIKIISAATFTCACPEGAKLDVAKGACVCPAGQKMQSKNIGGSVYTMCTPLPPPPTAVAKPVPQMLCPEGTRSVGGSCEPIARAQPVRPSTRCPPGTIQTATGCLQPKVPRTVAPLGPAGTRQPTTRTMPPSQPVPRIVAPPNTRTPPALVPR
jgi:hypothetical protein